MARTSLRRPLPAAREETIGFVMTPMIDIVFQLIIFFMLVLDFTKNQLEDVDLPRAETAEILDPPPLFPEIILNVLDTGTIKVNGQTVWKPGWVSTPEEHISLIDLFENRRYKHEHQQIKGDPDRVNYPVLVRMDASAQFQHLQKILMAATGRGGVEELHLAAIMPPGRK